MLTLLMVGQGRARNHGISGWPAECGAAGGPSIGCGWTGPVVERGARLEAKGVLRQLSGTVMCGWGGRQARGGGGGPGAWARMAA